jgi:hypothetical protein
MILSTATVKTRDSLTKALVATMVLTAALAIFFGVRIAIGTRAVSSLNAESAALERRLRQGDHTDQNVAGTSLPHGLAVLGVLQSAVTKAAAANGCQITEFKAGTTIAPYLPRYKKDLPDGAWSQMDAHFTLSGRLRAVVETLRQLNTISLPIEVDGLNLTRDSIFDDGSARINAQVQLRAISAGAAS